MIAGGLDLVDIEHVEFEVAVELDHVKLDHVELEVAVEVDHVGLGVAVNLEGDIDG